jgi:hypothetical protein
MLQLFSPLREQGVRLPGPLLGEQGHSIGQARPIQFLNPPQEFIHVAKDVGICIINPSRHCLPPVDDSELVKMARALECHLRTIHAPQTGRELLGGRLVSGMPSA